MTIFSPKSLYYMTPSDGRFLGHYVHRRVVPQPDDGLIFVDWRYENRPDLMALDLYGSEDYWMAIPLRNGLEDPVFDFKLGRELVVPSLRYIQEVFT